VKRAIYAGIGRVGFGLGAHHLLLRRRAAIAVFHRVDDSLPSNPITVTLAEFRSYLDFFSRYFIVVPLTEILERLSRGEPLGRRMAITFDDGYADNYDIAAPELERRGMPACFFICTGFIGTEAVPHWDAEWGVPSRWMTWAQVIDLRRRGFEIGAHTVTHPDLGRIAKEEARREGLESRLTLEKQLGEPVPLFCYPFGRTWHINSTNREAVRDAGFRCCLASHGGTVHPGDDPYRLLRAPIHVWHRSPYQYGLELLLDKTG
jgi:peptidoglycan/xylan/chitin deacetylase (PgdA/CDA1 family)